MFFYCIRDYCKASTGLPLGVSFEPHITTGIIEIISVGFQCDMLPSLSLKQLLYTSLDLNEPLSVSRTAFASLCI